MKKTRILSTTLITLASILAVVFCVLMGVFFTNKTSRSNNPNPNLNAATPEGNWSDYGDEPAIGSGTESDPWHIKTAEEFAYLTEGFDEYNVYLDADIDLGAHNWDAISSRTGTLRLYGQNHTISNLYVDSQFANFFRHIVYCEIRDVIFKNVQMTGKSASIINEMESGIVDNVHIEGGNISGQAGFLASGLVVYVYSDSIIQNCTNSAAITGYVVGGIAAVNDGGMIRNCTNTGDIFVDRAEIVGGIVGSNSSGTIQDCTNTGFVDTRGGHCGGICGTNGGLVKNCLHKVKIELGYIDTEELVGENSGEVIDCSIMLGSWTDFAEEPTVGSGTEADPWHIYNGEELAYLAATATANSNFYAYLEADIDLFAHDLGEEYLYAHEWVPIGNSSNRIKSIHLYGQGHTISNLYIDASETDYVGFIGYVVNGEIRDVKFKDAEVTGKQYVGVVAGYGNNVTFESINITGGNVTGTSYVGGVAGYIYSTATITNCTNTADITGTSNYVGGIAGYIYSSTITNCTNAGFITGKQNVGGITGQSNGVITNNCTNSENVIGTKGVGGISGGGGTFTSCINVGVVTGTERVGGIVGDGSILIEDCTNTGNVTGTSNYVGGIAGYIYSSTTITNCTNSGDVVGKACVGIVGGIISSTALTATVTDCINTGGVTGTSGSAGGMIGTGWQTIIITNCINAGDIIGNLGSVGGMIGETTTSIITTIRNCTNTGAVKNKYYAGGIAGKIVANESTITSCINVGEVTGTRHVGGIIGEGSTTITNCANTGAVTGYSEGIAGIAGYVSSNGPLSITGCINSGKVTSTSTSSYDSSMAGGVVGYGYANMSIEDCYNSGTVSGRNWAGGVVGMFSSGRVLQLTRCYNNGTVIATNYFGGLCANQGEMIVTDCVARCEIISSSANGSPFVYKYSSGTSTFASCYYDVTIKTSETDAGTRYKEYILGADETEEEAFSSDVWVVNSSTEMSSLPVPKSLMWVGDYLENNENILQFLKNNGFTEAAA